MSNVNSSANEYHVSTGVTIGDAGEQIANTVKAYLLRDEYGQHVIPPERQRPIFLIGPPGVGKTAIVKQVAEKLGIAFRPYSMTHHTRQSAVGLPRIVEKNYGGQSCFVSEYTMSEIISDVNESMEGTGMKSGILFLDELNCVSETLSPVMLQFLQYKTFGNNKLPEDWIIVAAGNPPEYNISVREYDAVTWDRLKRIDINYDYTAWHEYAIAHKVHPAIVTYLETKKKDLYHVEMKDHRMWIATPRGWDDLSQIIRTYEKLGIKVNEKLIVQYIQDSAISKNFAAFYDLYMTYQNTYDIPDILEGKVSDHILERSKNARPDERFSVVGLLLDAVNEQMQRVIIRWRAMVVANDAFKHISSITGMGNYKGKSCSVFDYLCKMVDESRTTIEVGKKAGSMSNDAIRETIETINVLDVLSGVAAREGDDSVKAYRAAKAKYDELLENLRKDAQNVSRRIDNAITFIQNPKGFHGGQQLYIFVTDITLNPYSAAFTCKIGSKKYNEASKFLLTTETRASIISRIGAFNLADSKATFDVNAFNAITLDGDDKI